jgi:hypothetical protein
VGAVHHALPAAPDDVEHLVPSTDDMTDSITRHVHGGKLTRRGFEALCPAVINGDLRLYQLA